MSKPGNDFASEMEELEQIVAWFERGDGDLDESLKKFERGMELAEKLKKHLETVENKAEVIRKKFDSKGAADINSNATNNN